MKTKWQTRIGWGLTAALSLMFIWSVSTKLPITAASTELSTSLGITPDDFVLIGIVEIVSLLLFIIPRTGILGTLLLAAYLGGAIATHLEHNESIVFPCLVQAIVWITAFLRFPELYQRLLGTATTR